MKLNSLVTFLLLAGLSIPAFAGHPNQDRAPSVAHIWAVEYAETALRQTREARRASCGFTGNRWSMNYRNHYEWALKKERRKGLVEIDRRNEALSSCRARYARGHGNSSGNSRGYRSQFDDSRGGHGQHRSRSGAIPDFHHLQRLRPDEFARWYADSAVAQSEENRIYGCGNKGSSGRWRGEWDKHYKFARQESRETAIREVEIRADQLSFCGRRG